MVRMEKEGEDFMACLKIFNWRLDFFLKNTDGNSVMTTVTLSFHGLEALLAQNSQLQPLSMPHMGQRCLRDGAPHTLTRFVRTYNENQSSGSELGILPIYRGLYHHHRQHTVLFAPVLLTHHGPGSLTPQRLIGF